MRLPNAVHEAHPWVIAEVAPDFELLDVWQLPTPGGPGDFPVLVEIVTSLDPEDSESRATRALFALRWRLGEWFGWDERGTGEQPIPGDTEKSLSARVPEELRDTVSPPVGVGSATFVPIYRTDDEWAAEISNSTVHGVAQLCWVEDGAGGYRGQMAVYVKPRGRFGSIYMAAISPFRHYVVYPALMRQIGRAWDARRRADPPA